MGFAIQNLQQVEKILNELISLDFIKSYIEDTKRVLETGSESTTDEVWEKYHRKELDLKKWLKEMTKEVSSFEKSMILGSPNFITQHLEQKRKNIQENFNKTNILNMIESYNSRSRNSIIDPKYFDIYWSFVSSLHQIVDKAIAEYITDKLDSKTEQPVTTHETAYVWNDSKDLYEKKTVRQLADLLGKFGYLENTSTSINGFRNLFLNNSVAPVNWTDDISSLLCFLMILIEEKGKIKSPAQQWKRLKKYFRHEGQEVKGRLPQIYSNLKNGSQTSAAEPELRAIMSELNV